MLVSLANLCCSRWLAALALVAVLPLATTGCQAFRTYGSLPTQPMPAPDQPLIPNPLVVPMIDRWAVMEQVSDELDNYFRLAPGEQIRILDGVMSEGRVETYPEIGSTLLEPWRKDSTPGFEKLHASLQTVRRFAKVRVIPYGNEYQIDVKVYKELEDLPQPMGSSIGGKLLRYDSSMDIGREMIEPVRPNVGWIPMGRDYSLEQKILANIQARILRCQQQSH